MVEDSSGSVTRWILELKSGDSDAARLICRRYFHQITKLARQRLKSQTKSIVDGEDVANRVFEALCIGLREGHYPNLLDRGDLWPLLLTITISKANDVARYQMRLKRQNHIRLEGSVITGKKNHKTVRLEDFISNDPTPELLATLAEQHQQLLKSLRDDNLRRIANYKIQGYTNQEISNKLNVSLRTVQRKINVIQQTWLAGLEDD